MKAITHLEDPRLIKALAHPLRLRILGVLENRTASPSEIAEELGAPLGNVSYHVRILAQFGLIKLVRRTPRRGAIEHHYESVGRLEYSDEAWSKVPPVVKEAMAGAMVEQISAYVNNALAAGGFDRSDSQIGRKGMKLDDQGFSEIVAEFDRLLARLEQIQEDAAERLVEANHEGEISVGLVMMLFEAAASGAELAKSAEKRPSRERRPRLSAS